MCCVFRTNGYCNIIAAETIFWIFITYFLLYIYIYVKCKIKHWLTHVFPKYCKYNYPPPNGCKFLVGRCAILRFVVNPSKPRKKSTCQPFQGSSGHPTLTNPPTFFGRGYWGGGCCWVILWKIYEPDLVNLSVRGSGCLGVLRVESPVRNHTSPAKSSRRFYFWLNVWSFPGWTDHASNTYFYHIIWFITSLDGLDQILHRLMS